jgi:hypothetical protein
MKAVEKARCALFIVVALVISIDETATWGQSLLSQGPFRVVAKSGDAAPGGNSHLDFKNFYNVTIDDQQRITFSAYLENNHLGVYGERDGQLQLLLGEGQSMPDAGGGMESFDYLSPTDIHWNNDGRIVASGYVSPSDDGLAVGEAPDGLEMVVVSGDAPPGEPTGVRFAWIDQAAINNAGEVAAFAIADGYSCGGPCRHAKWGFWQHSPTAGLVEVAVSGSSQADGRTFTLSRDTTQFSLNDSGVLVIRGVRDLNNGTLPDEQTIWRHAGGQLTALVKDGDPAPGPGNGATFWYISSPAIDAAGNAVFFGAYTYEAGGGGEGLWLADGARVTAVVYDNQQIPGTNWAFRRFSSDPIINSQGTVLFQSDLVNPSGGGSSGLFQIGSGGNLETIALKGDMPGALTDGARLRSFSGTAMNDNRSVVFAASLEGPNVTQDNDYSLWIYRDEELQLLAREGEMIELAPNDLRQLRGFDFESASFSNGHGYTLGLGPELLTAMTLYFTDNSQAVVTTAVGDYNNDGAVDAADYVVWRKNGGTRHGFEIWRRSFGATTAGGDSLSIGQVPEPASTLLVLSCAAAAAWTRRRISQAR